MLDISPLDGIRSPFGPRRGRAFSPSALFALAEPGVWYDPSDLPTLFTDTAGTTPVTTPGNTVARMNDKSGRGNNATQATAASRPTYGVVPLGGRRNLLTWSEDYSVALGSGGWTKSGVTASGQRITANAATGAAYVETTSASAPASAVTISATFPSTAGRNRYAWVADRSVSPIASATFDLDSVSVVGKATAVTALVVTLPDGSVKCSVTHTRASVGTSSPQFALAGATHTADRPSRTWVGGEFLDAKLQFEHNSTATDYQRVTTQYDVTQTGVQSVSYLFDDLDTLNWTASAGTYTVAYVNSAGTVTIETGQSLSGATDVLKVLSLSGYLAINRALTGTETTDLTAWLAAKGGA